MRRRALGITLEESKKAQAELEKQKLELQAAEAELKRQRDSLVASTKTKSGEISTQASTQITEAQAAEFLRLQEAKAFRQRAIVLLLVGSGASFGLVMWLISKENSHR